MRDYKQEQARNALKSRLLGDYPDGRILDQLEQSQAVCLDQKRRVEQTLEERGNRDGKASVQMEKQ